MKIVFLHWLGQDEKSWKNVISHLNIDVEIFMPNLFDFCENEKNFDEMYTWFEKFLEKFDEPVFLCGLSLGGTLALKYAISHKQKVSWLIIIGARMKFPKFLMSLQNVIFRFFPEKNFLKIGMKKSEFLNFSRSISGFDFSHDISRISCSVWVFIWEKDFANKKEAVKISKNIKNSELVILKNTHHEVNVENSDLLAKEIKKFLQKYFQYL